MVTQFDRDDVAEYTATPALVLINWDSSLAPRLLEYLTTSSSLASDSSVTHHHRGDLSAETAPTIP
jgi:hypothetical protein